MTTTPADPTVDSEIKGEIPATVPPADLTLSRYVEDRRELEPGHAVRLLRNGEETFPAWLAAIEAARHRISLEMYIFNDDAIGRQFADALARAAKRGVEVRVMYDYVGCRATPAEFFTRMRAQGVHTIAYHKYRFWRPRFWALMRRNHRKTLVCDGRVAFTGGLNIAIEWVGLSSGGGDWRDAVIQVEGPAVATIEAVFLRTWNRRAKKWARLDPARLPQPAPAGDVPLVVISNSEMRERFAIRRAALHAVRESRQRIFLANPYFVPDRGVLRALQHAARRGVDVRLLLPGESDSRILDLATRGDTGAAARRRRPHLAEQGGGPHQGGRRRRRLRVDRQLQLRPPVAGVQPRAGRQRARHALRPDVVAFLESDIAASEELTREAFGRRPLLIRLLERLAYSLRKWL